MRRTRRETGEWRSSQFVVLLRVVFAVFLWISCHFPLIFIYQPSWTFCLAFLYTCSTYVPSYDLHPHTQ